MDRNKVLGILTQRGGITSHTAILARSLGIPAVVGVPEVMEQLETGETLILDAVYGRAVAGADQETLQRYQAMQEQSRAREQEALRYRSAPAVTRGTVSIFMWI